jgi:hypothetical protein
MMPLKTLKNAESWNRKGETSCRHHTLSSASLRVFCGPLHAIMPLKTLKNAEI